MNNKIEFITFYLDDYVRMAYRELTKNVNTEIELKLISNLSTLLDIFADGELHDYILQDKII